MKELNPGKKEELQKPGDQGRKDRSLETRERYQGFYLPAHAVSLMVIVTLVLSAFLYNWAMVNITDKKAPKYELTCSVNEDGFFIVEVVGGEKECDVTVIDYYLLDDGDKTVPAQGELQKIWGQDILFQPWTNFSFADKNSDGNLGLGDYIVLKPAWKGGRAENGQRLRLAFSITGATMCDILLSNRTGSQQSLPESRWSFSELDQDRIIIDTNQSAATRLLNFDYFWEPLEFRIEFNRNGSTDQVINITFLVENQTLFQEERLMETEEVIQLRHNYNTSYPNDSEVRYMNYQLIIREAETNQTILVANYSLKLMSVIRITPSFQSTPFLLLTTGACFLGAGRCRRRKRKDLCARVPENI